MCSAVHFGKFVSWLICVEVDLFQVNVHLSKETLHICLNLVEELGVGGRQLSRTDTKYCDMFD